MSTRKPVMINGIYYGKRTLEEADNILKIQNSKVIPTLKNYLFYFPLELILWADEQKKSVRELIKEKNLDITKYYAELRDYQTVGTGYLYCSTRSILADGVGLGKTAEISALLNLLVEKKEFKRCIIAVETSALEQTRMEIEKFTGLRAISLLSETKKLEKQLKALEEDFDNVSVIVIKHSMLKSDLFQQWLASNLEEDENGKLINNLYDVFILDESSLIKNNSTKTYEYTKNLCNLAKRVHYLNATTFETNIMDVYWQLDMLDPNLLPAKTNIQKQFCKLDRYTFWKKDMYGIPRQHFAFQLNGYKNEHVFKESLKLVYFGRSKADVGMDNIPHVYKVYEVAPTAKQTIAIKNGFKWNEVLNNPSTFPELNIPFNRDNVPKLNRLLELIQTEFPNEKIMIYCFNIDAQNVIANELKAMGKNPVVLNGSVVDEERQKIIDEFNRGSADIIITNIKKSLNLNGGNVCICYTLETNPAKLEQIRGRIDRNVDDNVKTFVMLVYKDTPEYTYFTDITKQRAENARNLTLDAKTAIDFFIESMNEEE